jgi:dTDP-4-amino-4,6-dideoxygalactose transaminase
MRSFGVVDEFERVVAEFAGSKYAVAVNTGTSALFLSLMYRKPGVVWLPARTFISVPMAVIHAGGSVEFKDYDWTGVYKLDPLDIIDGALRFRRGMYQGGLHCLSFHARKLLNIGEGGMILTDDPKADAWLRKARYSGRGGPTYRIEDVEMIGWQCYMTPEKAARGLHLMEYIAPDLPDQVVEYVDLRKCPAFRKVPCTA